MQPGARTKVVDLAGLLHSAGDAHFSQRGGNYDEGNQQPGHDAVSPGTASISVSSTGATVDTSVRATRITPAAISTVPAHRAGLSTSCNSTRESNAVMT